MEVSRQHDDIDFDLIDQLKHICVKIPLFQDIKDIPIYTKAIKDACFKKLDARKRTQK